MRRYMLVNKIVPVHLAFKWCFRYFYIKTIGVALEGAARARAPNNLETSLHKVYVSSVIVPFYPHYFGCPQYF